MGKKDPKTVSGANSASSRNKQQLHEGHKTTAATIAKVAAAQEEVKQSLVPLSNGSSEQQPPRAPPKDSKKHLILKGQLPSSKSAPMAPSATNTAAAISRIAENGAPPLKLSTMYGGQSKSRLKGSSKSSKSASKSQSSLSSGSPAPSRHHSSPSSPGSENPPPLPQRPHPQRSSSAEGGSLLSIVKKGREQIQADGSKVAKFFGKKGHEAWDKIKKQKEKDSKSQKSNGSQRDTSNDVDVFGMELKDAVMKTRVVKERKQSGDAAYWMPALAYRCLQYVFYRPERACNQGAYPLIVHGVLSDTLMSMDRSNWVYTEYRGVRLSWRSCGRISRFVCLTFKFSYLCLRLTDCSP